MATAKAFKRKMLLWASSWSQEDTPQAKEVSFTPNATEIALLLQSIGFRVRYMDRCKPEGMHPVPGVPRECPACRVILMCPKSGLRIELDAQTTTCTCLPRDSIPELLSTPNWEITEDRGQETLRSAVDAIVPKPSSDVAKAVSELIAGMFHVLGLLPDQNHNDTSTLTTSALSSNSPMKTPASGITVVTPNAPCIPKASPEESKTAVPGRYRSLDTLIASGGFAEDLPEPGQLTPKEDGDSEHHATAMEVDGVDLDSTMVQGQGSGKKKFFSKSSPAINCTEQFQRSNTFVFEDDRNDPATTENKPKPPLIRRDTYISESSFDQIDQDHPRAGPPPKRTPSPAGLQEPSFSQSSVLLSKLQDIQQSVSDLIFMVAGNEKNLSNIGDVSKASKAVAGALQRITDAGVRPIRCLSDFGSVPNLSRTNPTSRTIPRLNSARRHGTAGVPAPATPRTSRRSGCVQVADSASKRVCTAGTTPGAGKSSNSRQSSRLSVVHTPGSSVLQKICASPTSSTAAKSNAASAKDKDAGSSSDKKQSILQSLIPKPGHAKK